MKNRKKFFIILLCLTLFGATAVQAAPLIVGTGLGTDLKENATSQVYANARLAASVLQNKKLQYWDSYLDSIETYLQTFAEADKPHFSAGSSFAAVDGYTFTETLQAGDANRQKSFNLTMTIDGEKGGAAAASVIKSYIPQAVVKGDKVTVEILKPSQAYLTEEMYKTLVRKNGEDPEGGTTFAANSTITFGENSTIDFGNNNNILFGDNTTFDKIAIDGNLEIGGKVLSTNDSLEIAAKDGAGSKSLDDLDLYADTTKFHGDVEVDGDLKGKKLILTDNTETIFRGGSDGIPEYSTNSGGKYYDFITEYNMGTVDIQVKSAKNADEVSNVTLQLTGGATGKATQSIIAGKTYTLNIDKIDANKVSNLTGTLDASAFSTAKDAYDGVTVQYSKHANNAESAGQAGKTTGTLSVYDRDNTLKTFNGAEDVALNGVRNAYYADTAGTATTATAANKLNGLTSTSGTLATQDYVKSYVASNSSSGGGPDYNNIKTATQGQTLTATEDMYFFLPVSISNSCGYSIILYINGVKIVDTREPQNYSLVKYYSLNRVIKKGQQYRVMFTNNCNGSYYTLQYYGSK